MLCTKMLHCWQEEKKKREEEAEGQDSRRPETHSVVLRILSVYLLCFCLWPACLLGDAWEIRFLFPSSASSVLSTYVYIGRHRHHLDKHRRADGPVIPFFVIIVQQQWIIGVENRSEFSSLAKSPSFMVHNESIYFVHSSKHPPALHS